jgi:hypothetical protein
LWIAIAVQYVVVNMQIDGNIGIQNIGDRIWRFVDSLNRELTKGAARNIPDFFIVKIPDTCKRDL